MAKNIKNTTLKEYQTIKLRELITELETLSKNGENDDLEVLVCNIYKFRKHDDSIVCFDTDEERNITSTGIYHDELFNKDFIGIGIGGIR
jgi:hypothetical protein